MKPTYILYLLMLLVGCTFAAETSEERDLSPEFGSYAGAFVLYDEAQQRWLRYQPEQCRTRTSPCSTFKVLNSLIALETGAASGADYRGHSDVAQDSAKT